MNPIAEIWTVAKSLSGLVEVDAFFRDFPESIRNHELPDASAKAALNQAIQTAMEVTIDDANFAWEVISRHILPVCLERSSAPIPPQIASPHDFRDYLSRWIEQYPDGQRVPLRSRILGETLESLRLEPTLAAIWTILVIGLRSPAVEDALRRLVKRRDEIGNAAIGCFAALSPAEDIRNVLVNLVLRRLANGSSNSFGLALQELASSHLIPALVRQMPGDTFEQMRFVGYLGRIAERAPNNRALQAKVWRVLKKWINDGGQLRHAVLFTGHGIASCNTPEVMTSLTKLLEVPNANLFLVFSRLRDCIKPEQLLGWRAVDQARLTTALTPVATQSGGGQSASRTVESHHRSLAWEVALCAGATDLDDWLMRLLESESNPYGKQEILSFASHLRLRCVPSEIEALVRARVDITHGGTEPLLGARLQAVQVLRATPTPETFDILLDSGLSFQGSSPRRTAEAVADVAERLSLEHRDFVLSRLFGVANLPVNGHRRMLAIAGLQRLAAAREIPDQDLPRLLLLADDDTLPAYARAYVLGSLGCFSNAGIEAEIIKCLRRYASDAGADEELRLQSLDALIRLNAPAKHGDLFVRALGLPKAGQPASADLIKAYRPWQAVILGNLLLLEPELYRNPARELVLVGRGEIVHMLLWTVSHGEIGHGDKMAELAQAAIARTKGALGKSFGETDNFESISRLAPGEFVTTEWEKYWADWMPPVRAALAEAITVAYPRLPHELRQRVFDLLESLLSDSTYQVRRSAGRTYSGLDCGRFCQLADKWSDSGSSELRRRAAEMAQWMPVDDDLALDNRVMRELMHDPEPSVRTVARQSLEAFRNRASWKLYVDRIAQERSIDGNAWIAKAYPYGQALAKIGDDDTVRAIRNISAERDIPFNVQNWLDSVGEAIESNWRDVTRKWPDPWLPWSGLLEEVEGQVIVDGAPMRKHFSLWCQRQDGPTDTASWGGAFRAQSASEVFRYFLQQHRTSIVIDGRRSAEIVLNATGTDGQVLFVGNGPYPEAPD